VPFEVRANLENLQTLVTSARNRLGVHVQCACKPHSFPVTHSWVANRLLVPVQYLCSKSRDCRSPARLHQTSTCIHLTFNTRPGTAIRIPGVAPSPAALISYYKPQSLYSKPLSLSLSLSLALTLSLSHSLAFTLTLALSHTRSLSLSQPTHTASRTPRLLAPPRRRERTPRRDQLFTGVSHL